MTGGYSRLGANDWGAFSRGVTQDYDTGSKQESGVVNVESEVWCGTAPWTFDTVGRIESTYVSWL